jgi:hypothetical protein
MLHWKNGLRLVALAVDATIGSVKKKNKALVAKHLPQQGGHAVTFDGHHTDTKRDVVAKVHGVSAAHTL